MINIVEFLVNKNKFTDKPINITKNDIKKLISNPITINRIKFDFYNRNENYEINKHCKMDNMIESFEYISNFINGIYHKIDWSDKIILAFPIGSYIGFCFSKENEPEDKWISVYKDGNWKLWHNKKSHEIQDITLAQNYIIDVYNK